MTKTVSFKTHDAVHVLCAEDGGGPQGTMIGDQPAGLVVADRQAVGPWEEFTVERLDANHIALKSHNGFYLCAEGGGGDVLVANRQAVGPWETFTVVPAEDGVGLQCSNGQFVCAEGGGGGEVRCNRDRLGVWETFTPSLSLGGGRGRKTVGRMRIENNCFVDDNGPINPVYCHAGDLYSMHTRDRARAKEQMARMEAAGYLGPRSWTALAGDYWRGREVNAEDDWNTLRLFRDDLCDLGLRAVLSQGDVGAIKNRKAFMENVAALDNERPFIDWIDGGNEAWQTGLPEPEKLAQFLNHYKNAGGQALRTLTSPPGEEVDEINEYSIAPAEAYDVHTSRGGHSWDKRRHIFSIPYSGERPPPKKKHGINSEGPGHGPLVSASQNKEELDHEAMALIGVAAILARQTYVWFSGEGVMIHHGLQTETGFASAPRMIAQLPVDVMSYETDHHSGDSWGYIRVLIPPIKEVRIDGRTANDGRFAYTIDGPSGGYHIRVARSFEGILYDPGTGEGTPLSARAGETVPISFHRGRVLVGRAL